MDDFDFAFSARADAGDFNDPEVDDSGPTTKKTGKKSKAAPAVHRPATYADTPEQTAIIQALATTPPGQVLKVVSYSGTGKTSTAIRLTEAYPDWVFFYLAYNADIAKDAKKRFPPNTVVKTTHGWAFGVLGVKDWLNVKRLGNIRRWELAHWMKARHLDPKLPTGATLNIVAADVLATVRRFTQSADPAITRRHAVPNQDKTDQNAFLKVALRQAPDQQTAERNGAAAWNRYRDWLAEKAQAVWQSLIDPEDGSLPLEHDVYLKLLQLQGATTDYHVVIMDECFPAGTFVETDCGPVPIEKIVADSSKNWRVLSSKDGGKTLSYSSVTSAYKTPTQNPLVRILHESGEFVCTANHPIWIQDSGWKAAGTLQAGDVLSCLRNPQAEGIQDLFPPLLTNSLSQNLFAGNGTGATGENQSAHESGANRDTESDGAPGNPHKGFRNPQEKGDHIYGSRRQWSGADPVRTDALPGTDPVAARWAMEPRRCRVEWKANPSRASALLQDRHCFAHTENSYRSGWGFAPEPNSASSGCEENRRTDCSRVVSIEMYEQGDQGERDNNGVAPVFVYTLSVESGAYFAEGILVKNCQDANACVMDLFVKQPGIQVAIYDPNQAIYQFRGARDLASGLPGTQKPLSQSFRFGDAIAERANRVLAYQPAHYGGFIPLRGTPSIDSRIGTIDLPPYTVICRSNRGVFEQALIAVQTGLRINSGARDLETAILYVESAWSLLTGTRIKKMDTEMQEFANGDTLREESKSDPSLKWVVKLCDEHVEDLPGLCDKLRAAKTHQKRTADVLLITAHRSKGLEYNQVRLANDFTALDNDLLRAMEAMRNGALTDAETILQKLPVAELNLLYVALTRARIALQPNQTLEFLDALTPVLARLQAKAGKISLIDDRPEIVQASTIIADRPPPAASANPDAYRRAQDHYQAFLPDLQDALKIAALRDHWTQADWIEHVESMVEGIKESGYSTAWIQSAVNLYLATPKNNVHFA